LLEAALNTGDVHEAGIAGRIDEEIEVTVFRVVTVEDGSEDARIAAPVLGDDAANLFAMAIKSFRGPHAKPVLKKHDASW
jgi:hypothetical protein